MDFETDGQDNGTINPSFEEPTEIEQTSAAWIKDSPKNKNDTLSSSDSFGDTFYIEQPTSNQKLSKANEGDVNQESNYSNQNGKTQIKSKKSTAALIEPPNEVDVMTDHFVVRKSKPFEISYEYLVWGLFTLITILCIVDRFVMKGDVVLERKGKRVWKLWGENIGQTITNVIWGITARLIITSQNLMFYTTLWCIPNLIIEKAPRFLVIAGIRDIHIKMHRLAGIFLIGIPSLAHVLVIFLPPLVDRTQLTYSPPSRFNYSQQYGNLNWTKIWDPAAVENWTFNDSKGVHLTSDEIYRLLLMVALFCLIFPLTRSQFLNNRSYSLAIAIHAFAGVWYAIDNIRKITHGLAHVFNLPVLLIWCIDRLISIVYYRKSRGTAERKIIGKNEYIDVRVKLNKKFKPEIGDVYFLLKSNDRRFTLSPERSHPFTSFSNHDVTDASWDIGFIITMMDDDSQWFPAWTRRLRASDHEAQSHQIKCWGPYRSSSSQLYKELEIGEQKSFVLLASGSGFGYLYDCISILAHGNHGDNFNMAESKPTCIDIHYTVRSIAVYKNFADEISKKLRLIQNNKNVKITFNWYVTEKSTIQDGKGDAEIVDVINLLKGQRTDFEKVIKNSAKDSSIYFVGRPSLADQISSYCEKHNQTLIKDFTNSQRGTSDKLVMVHYLKYTFYVIVITIVFSIFLHIFLK
ncbi:uncharacterized protein [Clytia hemisphaerica]|uniref:FAD-binding FR-type domain-containing protein n=2 Tax=Clytia hemisphaerica TaxID=252671 RepID=A0A7M5UXK0_9CNID